MTEVFHDNDSSSSDKNKSKSDESQDNSEENNQIEKEQYRSQVGSAKMATEIVTKEQSADEMTTQSLFIVIIVVLCLLILIMVAVCILKHKRKNGALVVSIPKNSAQGTNNSSEDISVEDGQKKQY